ncbi:MAG: RND family transporter [Candidatus Neomarinimicrobiota bacterium]|nr:MAG: RND family transporter [Candidatus Neomarinimicrobiota bacterium]
MNRKRAGVKFAHFRLKTVRRFSRQLIHFVSHTPRTLLAGAFFLTLIFLWKIPDLRLDPSLNSLAPQDHPIVKTMEKIDHLFGGSAIVVVAVESDSLLTRPVLEKYEALQDSLENLDVVETVTSLYTATSIVSSDEGFSIEPVLSDYPDSSAQIDSLKAVLLNRSQVVGTILSRDFRMMSFICRLNSTFEFDELALARRIEHIVRSFKGPEKIYYSGLPLTRADVTNQMRHDLKGFMPYGMILMILLLSLAFRSWLGVFLPLGVVILSSIWTFGLMAWLDVSLPFTGILIPVMLIAIANDYGIHIIAHYYEFTRMNPTADRLSVIRKTVKNVNMPIFLAGITTVIGFLSLLGHVLPKAQEMGWEMSFGILASFVFSIVLIPAALTIAPRPLYLKHPTSMERMNRFLHAWGHFFVRFNRLTILGTVLVVLAAALGIQYIQVDANPDHYYKKNARIRMHNEAIARAFGGSIQISVLVEGSMLDPENLRIVEDLESHLAQNQLVTQTVSIVDVLKKMNRAFHDDDPAFAVIPDDSDLVSQFLFLYSLTGDESDLDPFLDDLEQPQHAQILARLNRIQTMSIADLVEDLQDYIRANYYDRGQIEVAGPASLLGVLSRMIVKGQIISLGISTLIIFLLMALVFRSLVGGLLSIVPLGSAILIQFGVMGFGGIELTISTAMLSSILVGIGIDYTVHFLWHLREHIREGLDLEEAIFTTLRVSGKGIVYNALSVILGFSVLLYSNFLPVNIFGGLIVMSIFICLLGALTVLPALISLFQPKFLYR